MKYAQEECHERINSLQELTNSVKARFKNQFDINIDPDRCQEIAMKIRELSKNSAYSVDKVFNNYFEGLTEIINSFANSEFTKKKP